MTPLVPLSMFGWPLVVCLMFMLLKPRVAVTLAFSLSWCFLPVAEFPIQGMPNYSKTTATTLSVLIATVLFNHQLLTAYRPKWPDVFAATFCIVPLVTSVTNGLGAYDGMSGIVSHIVLWGMPYFIGRLYFTRLEHLADLVYPIVVCALIYVPLCLLEVRLSPQLHKWAYGFRPSSFAQAIRGGGWRPTVFMNHGLMVAMWMGSALVLAIGLWRYGGVGTWRRKVPMWWIVGALAVTFLLLKSMGAAVLVLVGVGILALSNRLKSPWPIAALALCCVLYIGMRGAGSWGGDIAVTLASQVSEDRAGSLEFRLTNEDMLSAKARQRSAFGWGGWGRSRVHDEKGKGISITDGLWIITFGHYGITGLIGLYGLFLAGPVLLAFRCRPDYWQQHPKYAAGAAVSVVCILIALDSLPNAMPIPVVTVAMGAAASIALLDKRQTTTSMAKGAVDQNGKSAARHAA